MQMQQTRIGIIGGSGLYRMEALEKTEEVVVQTPWGEPSDAILTGEVEGVPVAFLARHGRQHSLLPGEVPYQANIYAMKQLGVRYLLSFSAVGSLSEEIAPLDLVVPDQYIDLTRQRPSSFFGQGVVAHVSMADPTCPLLGDILARAAEELATREPLQLHRGGTYLCMEGPQFSTRAESRLYRSMGASVIGMTNMPEARLAREAQIAYASLAMVTDFDCWHPKEAQVTAELAIRNLMQNAQRAQQIARAAILLVAQEQPGSSAHSALREGLVTPLEAIAPERRPQIDLLLQ